MSVAEDFVRPIHNLLRGRPILFHGIKRSGNHAILNWILTGDRFQFRNNVLPFLHVYPKGQLDAQTHKLDYPVLGRMTVYNWLWKKRLITSVEDQPISRWIFEGVPPLGVQNVLLVRTPVNLFASQIKRAFNREHRGYPRTFDEIFQRTRRLWIEHARECVGETSLLPNKVAIVYDRFIVDEAYRASIAAALGITPDDASLTRQAPEGQGSSFHGDTASKHTPDSADALGKRAELLDAHERALLDEVLDEPEVLRLGAKLLDFRRP